MEDMITNEHVSTADNKIFIKNQTFMRKFCAIPHNLLPWKSQYLAN